MTKADGKVDANRTIQIDLDDLRNELEISDVDPATIAAAFVPVSERAPGGGARQAPPPLPPLAPGEQVHAPNAPSVAASERRSTGFYVALVVALLAVGGLGGALAARSRRAPVAAAAPAASASNAAPAATIIGIPTVEITDTPSEPTERR